MLVKLASLSLLAILPVLFKEALRTAIQKLSLLLARSAVAPDLKPIEQSLSSLVDGEASQSMKHSLKHHLFCDTNPLPSPSFSTISSQSSSPDQLVLHFNPLLHYPQNQPSPLHHHHTSSMFDLPYPKAPSHFTPFI